MSTPKVKPRGGSRQKFAPTFTGGTLVKFSVEPGRTAHDLLDAAQILANACVHVAEGAAQGGMDSLEGGHALWLAAYSMQMVEALVLSALDAVKEIQP